MPVSVHKIKALPDDLRGLCLFVYMSGGYVGISGKIHNFCCIEAVMWSFDKKSLTRGEKRQSLTETAFPGLFMNIRA